MSSSSRIPDSNVQSYGDSIIKPKSTHTHTIVWLHGLGDEGSSWSPAFVPLQKTLPGLKIICPTAPVQPVTLNFGMSMTSWHDIKNLHSIDAEDYAGLAESVAIVRGHLEAEIKAGIPSENILLGGFSQGAGMSLLVGYQFEHKLAGVCALSGYLPFNGDFKTVLAPANAKTPAFIGHGETDPVVNIKAGVKASESLTEAGVPVSFHKYKNMAHHTIPTEIRDLFSFINECFTPVVSSTSTKTAPSEELD